LIILACDACKRQSPDAEGNRVADRWLTVIIQTQSEWERKQQGQRLILCDVCLPLHWTPLTKEKAA
jgi:hypothetical protein